MPLSLPPTLATFAYISEYCFSWRARVHLHWLSGDVWKRTRVLISASFTSTAGHCQERAALSREDGAKELCCFHVYFYLFCELCVGTYEKLDFVMTILQACASFVSCYCNYHAPYSVMSMCVCAHARRGLSGHSFYVCVSCLLLRCACSSISLTSISVLLSTATSKKWTQPFLRSEQILKTPADMSGHLDISHINIIESISLFCFLSVNHAS